MPAETILVLGGTAEAAALARRIALERPADRLIVSLAGRTKALAPSPGESRIGGFGGSMGLAEYVCAESVTRLVDATHPFAVGMSRNAEKAAALTGVPRIALVRPAWEAIEGDRWIAADCLAAARDALPAGARPFLALGRQHLAPFAARPDLAPVLRMVDASDDLPFPAEVILGKPDSDWQVEAALLTRLGVTHLVCRNSGGAASYAKVEAARRLGLPVVMIQRAVPPAPPIVGDVAAVMDWLAA
ncbi:precorrin-6A reductase [Aureimonas sp. SA4125]|uniref:cobalt-precorrin-6A reductase n=1 Tax=Aureimonas sp. SA4125 TaxID=2826993 RepID=UPI001CC45C37|nr:cobalt-precorrin-6A reductase [Aureimonas sp. SA4125]BDA82594.1 precorrin-6A reductase [Aureimonas sp. SA4125]